MTSVYDFTATGIDGDPVELSQFQGSPLLIVNTASQCGFTPQYRGLEALHRDYADKGLRVLGFPCDQFGHQEPGDEEEIKNFCSLTYEVTFPMFAKVDVNGPDAHPLFAWLRDQKSGVLGGRIKWNFTKFLIGRDGSVVARYSPTTKPEKLAGSIEEQL
ncbi:MULTISPECIES: glutathione peroxidase [unclassified Gordonia (in: high G+C Gram-positive bacteria)]|uniref:glutathione peroxidase n=1 Tax=unclassified Gordonia (in: high G+C Gram-positive bacteria) TaxID=2657482 RepID=UPI00083A1D59|nr:MULTISPECIES: glutathione peroxidase [unclassified Gordonia (in: high G+C Gram-positive bacteria)]MBN0975455.1 glutathione peroxidase [Gordonia sp. BP-119]MBN0985438.1 glutathione peroxidase [Gordonia sp. BP-94]OCW85937.1 glutathione peroxidase [Nocardia farcinica]